MTRLRISFDVDTMEQVAEVAGFAEHAGVPFRVAEIRDRREGKATRVNAPLTVADRAWKPGDRGAKYWPAIIEALKKKPLPRGLLCAAVARKTRTTETTTRYWVDRALEQGGLKYAEAETVGASE